jgi:hypothetical protein
MAANGELALRQVCAGHRHLFHCRICDQHPLYSNLNVLTLNKQAATKGDIPAPVL